MIAVTNAGEDPTSLPITVVDTLPDGLTFAGASGDAWECTAAGQIVTCTNPGPIAADADLAELRLEVDVTAEPGETVTNQAAVFSDRETPDDETSVDAVVIEQPVPTTTTTTTTTTTPGATTTTTSTPGSTTTTVAGATTTTDPGATPTTRPGSSSPLPVVGSNSELAVIALVLLAAGGALWLTSRRRSATSDR